MTQYAPATHQELETEIPHPLRPFLRQAGLSVVPRGDELVPDGESSRLVHSKLVGVERCPRQRRAEVASDVGADGLRVDLECFVVLCDGGFPDGSIARENLSGRTE
jgi:hypothetical protein